MYAMKKNGLYDLRRTDFDDISEMILKEYAPETLEQPRELDIERLVLDNFYLDISKVRLSKNGKVLGLIAFEDTQVPIVDDSDETLILPIPAGRILIEKSLYYEYNRTKRRFTEVHELSHWIMHRSYYSQRLMHYSFRPSDCSYIAYSAEEGAENRTNPIVAQTDEQWIEWQADCMSASLLMPKKTFLCECNERAKTLGVDMASQYFNEKNAEMKPYISAVARTFGVSARAATIRMKQLNLIHTA